MRERQVAVTVEGCIRDRRLKIAQDSVSSSFSVKALEVTEFTLDGPKELLQQLKSGHNDHQDLVTGITIVPDTRTDDDLTTTIEVGKKTRINAGSSNNTESNPVAARSKILNLRVTSIKHLADRCSFERGPAAFRRSFQCPLRGPGPPSPTPPSAALPPPPHPLQRTWPIRLTFP